MSDFLMRDDAPLTAEEWAKLDEVVVGVAKKLLVGRRLISIYGPFGAGMQTVTVDRYQVNEACLHQGDGGECNGKECDCAAVDIVGRDILTLPMIHKDFVLHWQDIATSRQFHMPLDLGQVGAASAMVAMKEDQMIFGALLDKAGAKVAAKPDKAGSDFASFVEAAAALAATGNIGPYAAVVSPATYAKLHRPMAAGMGILEIVQVRELASGGLYQTSALKDGQALLISQGAQNLDLALGQDLATAYLGPDKMDHLFRVFETLALRIKRPEAICLIV
jgi:uncharacterized linocin/CFP29 family protein